MNYAHTHITWIHILRGYIHYDGSGRLVVDLKTVFVIAFEIN